MDVGLNKHVFQAFASAARSAGSAQVSNEYTVDGFSTVSYIADLTAVSGSPSSYSLVTKIQYSPETSGTRWYDLPNTTLTLSSVTNSYIINVPLLTGRRIRVSYTLTFVGGTSPQATFSVDVAYGNTPPSSNITNTGTAASVADGADVAEGSTSDAAYAGSGSASEIGVLKGIYANEGSTTDAAATAGGTGSISAKLRKISADIATLLTQTDGLEASLTSIDGKTPASPATTGKQDTGNTSLAAIDANAGITTDAAVTTDANGTLSAKLRGLVKLFNDVWDSTNHKLQVKSTGDIASGSADSGNPVKVGGVYNSSAPTFTTGQRGDLQFDANGNTKTREQYAPGYEDNTANRALIEERLTPTYISTATTTTAKSGSGLLGRIVVTGGTAGTIIIYDNTAGSGTILASFDSTNALATYTFNAVFATGCTVVTGAATKVTVLTR